MIKYMSMLYNPEAIIQKALLPLLIDISNISFINDF